MTADIDDGQGQRWRHMLTVNATHPDTRIAGIFFFPVADPRSYTSWDEVDGDTCRPVAERGGGEPRPVGSAFKLYVLGALADAVEAGSVAWDDELVVQNHLRSIPAGLLQDAERGTTVTVAEAAELMMAISDNTATDHLIDILGR